MPAYNFKPQFADKVESGQKRQTIRRERKRGNPAADESMLYLYTGMRTKGCRLLLEALCVSVLPILITRGDDIMVGDVTLDDDQIHDLAIADGFDCTADFVDFFEKQYGLPFEGLLIEW